MTCDQCGAELAYLHGHATCTTERCPWAGANLAECCDGGIMDHRVEALAASSCEISTVYVGGCPR